MTARSHEMLWKGAVEGFRVLYTFFFFSVPQSQAETQPRQEKRKGKWCLTSVLSRLCRHHQNLLDDLPSLMASVGTANGATGHCWLLSMLQKGWGHSLYSHLAQSPLLSPFRSVAMIKLWDFLTNMAGEEEVWHQEARNLWQKKMQKRGNFWGLQKVLKWNK